MSDVKTEAKPRTVSTCSPRACAHCPWRESNQGKRHPGHYYTLANLKRLWNGLRSGEAPGMTCHPTDPNNPVPEGCPSVPDGVETRECTGALLLVTRELKLIEKTGDFKEYRRLRRAGLSREGIIHWALGRCKLGGTIMGTGAKIPLIEEDSDVQYGPLKL